MALFQNGSPDDSAAAGGLTSIVAGLLALSVQMWAGPAHIMDGINYADAFHNLMLITGSVLVLAVIGLIAKAVLVPQGSLVGEKSII